MTKLPFLFVCGVCVSSLVGCGGDGDGDDGDDGTGTEVQGVTQYRDATADAMGTPRDAAVPEAQDAMLTVTVRGTGVLGGVEPTCLDQAAGEFHALYAGDVALDGSGGYVSSLGEAGAVLETPAGCAIPELTVGVITEIVVRAELEATTANCEAFCDASARADAQAECAASPDAAACWAQAEGEARTACSAECTTQSTVVVAEASIGASAIGELGLDLDADALRAAALGEIAVDLTFDALE